MARASDASQRSASRRGAHGSGGGGSGGGDSPLLPAVVQHSVAGDLLLPSASSPSKAAPRSAAAAAPSPAGSNAGGGASRLRRSSTGLGRASVPAGKAARRDRRYIDSDTESDILKARLCTSCRHCRSLAPDLNSVISDGQPLLAELHQGGKAALHPSDVAAERVEVSTDHASCLVELAWRTQDEDVTDEKEPLSRTAALRRRLTKNLFITVPVILSALLMIAGLALVTVRPDKQVPADNRTSTHSAVLQALALTPFACFCLSARHKWAVFSRFTPQLSRSVTATIRCHHSQRETSR